MPRDNYYVLLGLDPDRDTTWGAIEPVLKKKRTEWSMPHPTKKLEYQKNRALLPDIEKVLKNDETRRGEADEARRIVAERRSGALQELDKLLEVTGAKGYLTEDDVKALTNAATGRWNAKDVRDRAAARGLKVQVKKAEVKRGPVLDSTIQEQISAALRIADAADLYALLKLPKSTSSRELHQRSDAEYQQIRTHGDKTQPDVNARQELYGLCLKIFASDGERDKYDNALAQQRLKSIMSLAEAAGAGEGRIVAKVMDELIKEGKKGGLAQEEVVASVVEVATRRKWTVEVPSVPSAQSLQVCGACGALGPIGKNCSQCGASYEIACPKCRATNVNGARTCVNCRFEIGDMPLAERALRSAKALLADDPASASKLVEEALRYWPGHPQATQLKSELERQREARQARETTIRDLLEKVNQSRRKREFEAARKPLDELARIAPTHADLPALRTAVTTAMKEAESQVNRAKALQAQGKMDDALDAYDAALAACADFQAARDGLARCPPLPPVQLQAQANSSAIVLQWKASSSRGQLHYVIVRKADSAPTRPDDGQRLGATPSLAFHDPSAPSGGRWFYAVFSERSGAASHQAAVVGPVVRTAEISNLAPQAGDARAVLHWKAPPGVKSIEVWRKAHSEPLRRGDGTRVSCTLESAVDQDLVNGTPYGYRIVSVFAGGDGQPLASQGVTCLVVPVTPPTPVTDLNLEVTATAFRATYTPPARGLVQVFRLPGASPYSVGQGIPASDVPALGKPLPSFGPNVVGEPLAGKTELHLLPVSVVGSAYIAGKSVSRSWVPEIEGLAAQYRGISIVATWNWPPGVAAVTLVVREGGHAESPNDRRAVQTSFVTADQYQVEGGRASLVAPPSPKLFLTAFAAVHRQGVWRHATGQGTGSRCEITPRVNRVARYAIRAKGGFLNLVPPREYVLNVVVDGFVELPELLIVSKPDGLPVRPGDGTVLLKTKSQRAFPDRVNEIEGIAPPAWRLSHENTSVFHACDDDGRWLELLRDR